MRPEYLMSFLPNVVERLQRYQERGVDETISVHDNMFETNRREHYFATGRDAISIIARAMIDAGVENIHTIVDLPCGSGRVLRHLVRFLPEASVIASDIDPQHVEFCQKQFGAEPMLSYEDLTRVVPDRPVDILWCGSLLSHLPASSFKAALRHMVGWLRLGGIGLFTFHGRWSMFRQAKTPYPYMDNKAFVPIVESVRKSGFGFVEYADPDSRLGQKSYGFSVSLPSWVTQTIEEMDEVRLVSYGERGWDNHQDVLVLKKTSIAARPWMFEEQ